MGKPKKVLFTSHTANFQKFNRPFMRMLREQGAEVHYASMGEEEIQDCDKSFVVPFTRSPFKLSNIQAYRQLKQIIDREDYDLIHTHTPMGSVVTRLAARAARKRGTRVIYTAHGFHFFKGAPLLNWLIYYPVEKWMAKHTDILITINKEDYGHANKKFKTNVKYVPGVGIDPVKFDVKMTKAEKSRLRESLGLKDDSFVLLYPAELNKNKNQTMLIRAMEKLIIKYPDIHLLLPGKDSLNDSHQKVIEKKGLGENVHLLGYRNDIPQLLKIADLSVSASKREGLPVNIMEAMYLGVPAIVTDCRGNRDLILNAKTGYTVADSDIDAFIERVEYIYKDKEARLHMSVNAQEQSKRYLLDTILRVIAELYDQSSKERLQKKYTQGIFVHDFKYLEYEGKAYGDGQFEYHNLWKKKYLTIFDSLTVVARGAVTNNPSSIKAKYRLDGEKVRFVMTDSLSSIKRLFNSAHVSSVLRGEIERADIAIVRLPSIQGLIACRLLERMGKPYILEVVGSSFDSLWYHDRIKGKIAAAPLHLLTKYYIKKAKNVIYVTNEYLQKQYPNNNNTLACSDVIIESLDKNVLYKRVQRIKRYSKETTYKVGLVGSYDVMYKGHDVAIKALSRISKDYSIELHFLGSGNKEYWVDYAKKHGVDRDVFFDKPVSAGAQMLEWIDSMDVLLVPSKTEGMPRVLLEGLGRASVIIGTRVGDIPSVLEAEDVVDKYGANRLANRMQELLSKKNLMQSVAERNFKRANSFLLPELTARRHDFIYRILAKEDQ